MCAEAIRECRAFRRFRALHREVYWGSASRISSASTVSSAMQGSPLLERFESLYDFATGALRPPRRSCCTKMPPPSTPSASSVSSSAAGDGRDRTQPGRSHRHRAVPPGVSAPPARQNPDDRPHRLRAATCGPQRLRRRDELLRVRHRGRTDSQPGVARPRLWAVPSMRRRNRRAAPRSSRTFAP